MKPAYTTNQHYQEKLKSINDYAKRDRARLGQFFARFPGVFEFAQEIETLPGIYCAYCSYSFGGSFTVNILDLDGFRGEEFIDNLHRIETFFGVEFNMEDKPEHSSKWFTAEILHDGGTLHIRVEAKIKSDATQCHRVVIGETVETVRVPTYKLICPEIA